MSVVQPRRQVGDFGQGVITLSGQLGDLSGASAAAAAATMSGSGVVMRWPVRRQ
jgi:hypothetical protein